MELKMRKILLITLLLIVGCSKEPINYETTLVERDGVFYTKDTNKPYSGDVFSLDKNGEIEEEKTLKNGIVWNGSFTFWYENGQKEWEETYKDGEEDGLSTWWYKNGQKRMERPYKDGKRDGLQTQWYENGQKSWEGTYKDGELDGLVTQWMYDGQKWDEGTYKDGERDGLWTYWSILNGQKISEGTYKDGKKHGLETNWFENGKKSSEKTYKDGELISEECWDEDGNEIQCS